MTSLIGRQKLCPLRGKIPSRNSFFDEGQVFRIAHFHAAVGGKLIGMAERVLGHAAQHAGRLQVRKIVWEVPRLLSVLRGESFQGGYLVIHLQSAEVDFSIYTYRGVLC